MRSAEIIRKTAETDIMLTLNLDGTGMADIATGCGFLDHLSGRSDPEAQEEQGRRTLESEREGSLVNE